MSIVFPTSYNPTAPTELCRIMGECGSDKGNASNNGWHNYTTFYSALMEPIRHKPLRIFELGLGTNNIDVPSNMGLHGVPGASLRGWRTYFPNATVYGADIDRRILFTEDRIHTFWCDQLSPTAIEAMWNDPLNKENFDIIIEDGLHTFEANKCFFEHSIYKIKSGGIYMIEDVIVSQLPRYEKQLEEWAIVYPNIKFHIVNIPHRSNSHDNCVIVALVN